MFFLLPLVYCEASVVKIVQRGDGGRTAALSADGGRVEVTRDLGDMRTDFLLTKLSSTHDPLVQISPVLQQNKKLSIGGGRALALVHRDDDDRKWRIKKEGTQHKLMVGRLCLAVRGGAASVEDCEDHSPEQLFMVAAQDDGGEGEYHTSSESVYEIHRAPKRIYREILSEDSDYAPRPVPVSRPVPVVLRREECPEEAPRVSLNVNNVRVVTVTRTVKEDRPVPRSADHGRHGPHNEDKRHGAEDEREDENPSFPLSAEEPRHEPLRRRKKRHSDTVARARDRAPFERSVPGTSEGDAWAREKRTKQGEIEQLQRLICNKMDRESDSSSSEGLVGLIKAFGVDKRESDFLDIRTPSMFGKKSRAQESDRALGF